MDFGLIFLGVVFVTVAFIAMVEGVRAHLNGKASLNWNCVCGEIEESSIQTDIDASPYPAIRFKYFVEG